MRNKRSRGTLQYTEKNLHMVQTKPRFLEEASCKYLSTRFVSGTSSVYTKISIEYY